MPPLNEDNIAAAIAAVRKGHPSRKVFRDYEVNREIADRIKGQQTKSQVKVNV